MCGHEGTVDRPSRVVLINLAILILGLVVVLLVLETMLRLRYDAYDALSAAREKYWFREGSEELPRLFTLDPALGFRPVLDGSVYDEHGVLVNDYALEKRSGITRLLFIGDSVTARGKIIGALQKAYGDNAFEYWNAGVTSFNTVQEVEYFKRFNAVIHPDHVILTFHNNDFETTPVAFLDRDGRMVIYSPRMPRRNVNAALFRSSLSYRALLGLQVQRNTEGYRRQIVDDTQRSLEELSGILREQGIDLSVLILPILDRREHWRPDHAETTYMP